MFLGGCFRGGQKREQEKGIRREREKRKKRVIARVNRNEEVARVVIDGRNGPRTSSQRDFSLTFFSPGLDFQKKNGRRREQKKKESAKESMQKTQTFWFSLGR